MAKFPESVNIFVEKNKDLTYEHIIKPNRLSKWIRTEGGLPWLLWDKGFPCEEMLKEAKSLYEATRFVEHRDDCSKGWSSICLHGISAEHTGAPIAYGLSDDEVIMNWTDIIESCPITVDYFKNSSYWHEFGRIRYMALAPGGYLRPTLIPIKGD